MKRNFCIFCRLPLDGSDEHIIPQSLNGTLHSTRLICHQCNSNFFGQQIDPVIKKLFNPLLILLGWENASGIHGEGVDGERYLIKRGLSVTPVRPTKEIIEQGRRTIVKIRGDEKNALKMFQKEASRLKGKGKVLMEYTVESLKDSSPFIRAEWKIEQSIELVLLVNKIALEFFTYNNLDYEIIEELCKRVRSFDSGLNNVKFCNFENEVREFESSEVSHLIFLESDANSKTAYAYIELFNLICCIVILDNNYRGNKISYLYHQDALTGERFSKPINLKMSIQDIIAHFSEDDGFQYLNNYLSDRIRGRTFNDVISQELNRIMEDLKQREESGEISNKQLGEFFLDKSAEVFAELTVYDFPYILDDENDEDNDDYNFIHSNFRESIVDAFCDEYSHLIGKKFFTRNGTFVIDSFFRHPIVVKRKKRLIKLYCKLVEENAREVKYINVKTIVDIIAKELDRIKTV